MQNLKIRITPLNLNYRSQNTLSVLIKYKRILITTNHDLQKSECRQKFVLINNQITFQGTQIQKEVELSKEFQLMNTKVEVIILQCAELQNSKWKHQIKLLGVCTVDLGNFQTEAQYAISHSPCERQFKTKLDKCDDKDSQMNFLLQFQQIKAKKDKKKQKQLQNGVLKTQSYHKEVLISRRKAKPQIPNAYEISRKNYKQPNLSRQDHDKSKSSRSSAGSYKKRFQYQQVRNKHKKNDSMKIFPQKKKINHSDISPRPRLKTPEPIQSAQKFSIPTIKQGSKISHHHHHHHITKEKDEIYVISKSQISHYEFNESSDVIDKSYEELNESSDMENIKQNKYKIITEKLEAIDRKINSKKQTPREYYQETQEKPREPINPQSNSKQENSQGKMTNSEVSHFSPLNSSRKNKEKEISEQNVDIPNETSGFSKINKQTQYLSPPRVEKENIKTKEKQKEKEKQFEKKIEFLEEIIDETEEKNRKKVLQLQLDHKNRIKQLQKQKSSLIQQITNLKKENDSKHSLVEKLSKLYEDSDDRCFEIQKNHEIKSLQYEETIQGLLKKNFEQQTQLQGFRNQKTKSLIVPKRQEQGNKEIEKQMEQKYLSEKAKVLNLEGQLRQRDNDLKFMRLNYENIKEQKVQLEEEIEIMGRNNQKQMSRKGSISKLNMENSNISTSVKIQNKVLKEQIQSLQKQVHQLNSMLEGLINKSMVIDNRQHEKKQQQENWKNLNKKYQALQRQVDAYEAQLQQKKMKIADIINVIWKYDNPGLVEEVDHIIGIQ